MRSYETARSLFNFLAFCAWATVAVGVLAALVGMGTASQYARGGAGLLAGLPGLGISMFGLFLVAIIQNSRATVDTAEYTQQMLKVARDQLEVSRQGLRPGFVPTPGLAGLEPAKDPSPDSAYVALAEEEAATSGTAQEVSEITGESELAVEMGVKDGELEYAGHKVTVAYNTFHTGGKVFGTLTDAKKHIDDKAAKEGLKSIAASKPS